MIQYASKASLDSSISRFLFKTKFKYSTVPVKQIVLDGEEEEEE